MTQHDRSSDLSEIILKLETHLAELDERGLAVPAVHLAHAVTFLREVEEKQ